MIELLAILGGATTAAALGAIIWLAYKLVRAKDEQLEVRDLYEKLDEQLDAMVKERDGLVLELAAKTYALGKEEALRKSVEAERNEAVEQGVNYVVEKLKKSNIADVASFTATLLATPLPGWVPKAVPEGRATAPGPDSLLNPFAVQPTEDPGPDR